MAKREFNAKDNTLDEGLLHAEWPKLRDRLSAAMRAWEPIIEVPAETNSAGMAKAAPEGRVHKMPRQPTTPTDSICGLSWTPAARTLPTAMTWPRRREIPNGEAAVGSDPAP